MEAVLTATQSEPQELIDKASFWRDHTDACKNSQLTRAEYCRRHKVNYDQFGYWFSKLSKQLPSAALVPVKILPDANAGQSTLASLRLANGTILEIHSAEVLLLIIRQGA